LDLFFSLRPLRFFATLPELFYFFCSRKGANAEIISTHIVMHIIYKKISPELWAVGPTYL